MRFPWRLAAIIAFLILQLLPAFADDVITNFMSPVVSYQYYDAPGTDTNLSVFSPVVSYQFYDVSGDNTNSPIFSPVVGYQFFDMPGEDTNSVILSPIASYQYFDWPGNDVLNLQSSPVVSYYFPFLDTPPLRIIPTNRIPTTAEIASLLSALHLNFWHIRAEFLQQTSLRLTPINRLSF